MDGLSTFIDKFGHYIAIIPTIVILVIVIVGFLLGLLRGFRKNTILMCVSLSALIIAYLIFVLVLRKAFFEEFVLSIYNSIRGETLQQTLNVSDDNKRFADIISAFIESKLGDKVQASYQYFSAYVKALSNAMLGLIYMVVTIILWQLLYRILHLTVYLPFFREGKYKKKKQKEYEYYKAMDNIDSSYEQKEENSEDENESEPKKPNKTVNPYKRRRLLGGAIGILRGILIGVFAVSIFGTAFYVASGLKTDKIEEGDEIVVSYNGNNYDLTTLYEYFYEYDHTGLNHALNSIKNTRGVPIYVSVSSLFCKGKIKVSEDGINTTIYPIEELGNVMGILHDGVLLLNEYNILDDGVDTFDALKNEISTNEEFNDDLYKYIKSIGTSKFHRAIGKTISKHFYEIINSAGYSNKYLDVVFAGDDALTINDIVSKDDIKTFINIASKSIDTYDTYKENKDPKEIVINETDNVKGIVDEMLNLTVFNQDKQKINNVVCNLLELVCDKFKSLKGISFDGINFVGTDGIVKDFLNTVVDFLKCKLVAYEDNTLKFNYKNINSIFETEDGTASVCDQIKENEVLRRVFSKILSNTDLDSGTIYIPQSVLDSDGYIIASEFKGFFDSISDIITNTTFSKDFVELKDIASDMLPEIIESISSNSQMPGFVVESKLLSAIASNYIYESLSDSLSIPTELLLDENVREQNIENWLGTDGELYHLLNAAITYDLGSVITDGDEIGVDSILDADKISIAVESKIVHYTISKNILEEAETNTEINIPSDAVEDGVISKEEIVNSVKALVELEKDQETKTLDSISQNTILNSDIDLNIVLSSKIMWYTISNKFDDTEVAVPNAAYVDITSPLKYLLKEEIINTVDALKSLGQDDLENIDISSEVFLSLHGNSDKLDNVLSSYIAWYEISKQFKNKITDLPNDIKFELLNQEYISRDELKSVNGALNELGISTLNSYNITESALLNVSSIDNLLASHIAWYETTKKIISGGQFIVLEEALEYKSLSTYLKYEEAYNMLYVCKNLGLTSFTSSGISPVSIEANNLTSYIGDTLTLRATITNSILYVHSKGTIYLDNSLVSGFTLHSDNTVSKYVYSASETENIIKGLSTLNVNNYTDGLTFTMSQIIALDSTKRDIVLSSYTLWLYTSNLFISQPYTFNKENQNVYELEAGVVTLKNNYEVITKSDLRSYGA